MLPRSAETSEFVESPSPDLGDHVRALRGVGCEEALAVLRHPRTDALFEPLGESRVDLASGLGRPNGGTSRWGGGVWGCPPLREW